MRAASRDKSALSIYGMRIPHLPAGMSIIATFLAFRDSSRNLSTLPSQGRSLSKQASSCRDTKLRDTDVARATSDAFLFTINLATMIIETENVLNYER